MTFLNDILKKKQRLGQKEMDGAFHSCHLIAPEGFIKHSPNAIFAIFDLCPKSEVLGQWCHLGKIIFFPWFYCQSFIIFGSTASVWWAQSQVPCWDLESQVP